MGLGRGFVQWYGNQTTLLEMYLLNKIASNTPSQPAIQEPLNFSAMSVYTSMIPNKVALFGNPILVRYLLEGGAPIIQMKEADAIHNKKVQRREDRRQCRDE